MNRIIDISQDPTRLSYHLDNLVIETGDNKQLIPIKDVVALIISNPQVSLTHAVLSSP